MQKALTTPTGDAAIVTFQSTPTFEDWGVTRPAVESIHFPNTKTLYFEGDAQKEKLVRIEYESPPTIVYYQGSRGEEYKTRSETKSAEGEYVLHRYQGLRNCEYIESKETANGVAYYEGPKGEERCVRHVCKNGLMIHMCGPRGREWRQRVVHPNGTTEHYDQSEALCRIHYPAGTDYIQSTMEHFEGEAGMEALVMVVYNDSKEYYRGPQGVERKVLGELVLGGTVGNTN